MLMPASASLATRALPVLILWICLLAAAVPAAAQFETGSITGTVRDTSGGVLPGVSVTLRNAETGVVQTSTTNESGVLHFTLTGLTVTPHVVPLSPVNLRLVQ